MEIVVKYSTNTDKTPHRSKVDVLIPSMRAAHINVEENRNIITSAVPSEIQHYVRKRLEDRELQAFSRKLTNGRSDRINWIFEWWFVPIINSLQVEGPWIYREDGSNDC